MKGVILAGGTGSRLFPLTKVTNKHLLPVYDKPMIYFPLNTLLEAGIKDIMIISGKEHAGDFLKLLGSGKEFNARFTYEIQEEAGGIAQALSLAENFADNEKIAVVLGDNILEDSIASSVKEFESSSDSAFIFLKEVVDAKRFGVAELKGKEVVSIEEKPKTPKTNFAVTGIYLYPPEVFKIIKSLKPSGRGELEITDVNNAFIRKKKLKANFLNGFWSDAGTFESLFRAASMIKNIKLK